MKLFTALSLFAMASTSSAFTVLPSTSTSTSTSSPLNMIGQPYLSGTSEGLVSKTSEWEMEKISPIVRVEGNTRHTWNMIDSSKEMAQVCLQSKGRPITADVQLWIGPDWTPVTINCHSEDGAAYPIQTLVGTRNKASNVEVRNTGPYTMPITAAVSYAIDPLASARDALPTSNDPNLVYKYMDGGQVYHHSFGPEVDQLQVLLKTEGKQLNAKVELLNGPNNVKQEIEVFTNNGELNALFMVFDTPGAGNAIRVKNLAPLEYPCEVYTKPSKIGTVESGLNWSQPYTDTM